MKQLRLSPGGLCDDRDLREDETNHLNGTIIRDDSQLFGILDSLRTRMPFFCELVGENEYCLLVGIGQDGYVEYSRCDGEPPYLEAIASNKKRQAGHTEFLMGGTPTPISKHCCIPFETVREIAGYFRETGGMYPGIAWEEV
jgi:hypothetical protein